MDAVAAARVDAAGRVGVNTCEGLASEEQEWEGSIPSGMKEAV